MSVASTHQNKSLAANRKKEITIKSAAKKACLKEFPKFLT